MQSIYKKKKLVVLLFYKCQMKRERERVVAYDKERTDEYKY
jgi:hypothetical protein